MLHHRTLIIAALGTVAAACSNAADSPVSLDGAQFAKAAGLTCAASPDFVVTDEASFLAALGAAVPGDVIGIDGTVSINARVFVSVPDVTITCATAGSGVNAAVFIPTSLIQSLESGVTVSNLVLDGSNTGNGAFRAFRTNNPVVNAATYTFSDNEVTCGTDTCIFTGGSRGTIENNSFTSPSFPVSGIHIQGAGGTNPDGTRQFPSDDTRIVGNTLSGAAGSSNMAWGAIRLRDGARQYVAHNTISGPWANGMGVANLQDAIFEKNVIDGPAGQGILFWFGFGSPAQRSTNNVVRRNTVTNSGLGAFYAAEACGNTFFGNHVGRNDVVMGFDLVSGSNVFRGHTGKVIDNGDFDCDGDGNADPNLISGSNRVVKDPTVGQQMRDAARASGDAN